MFPSGVGVMLMSLKVLMTPGFLSAGDPCLNPLAVSELLLTARRTGGEPSWVIGDPALRERKVEDDGRTLRLPGARFKFYAIRDDHEEDCDCGCGGGSVVTFLLPDEY